MKYVLTPDLQTGNVLIDTEHRELLDAINNLMDACSQGKGKDEITKTLTFLNNYVIKHFSDEEKLQVQSKYPNYQPHKKFHELYKAEMQALARELATDGYSIAFLGKLNQKVAIIINHIKQEDKRLATHIKASK